MQPLCSQPLFSPPHTPDGGKGRFCFSLKWLEMRITTPLCCLALLAGRSQPSLQKPSAELPRFYQCGDQSPGNIKWCLRMCSELVGKAGATPSLHLGGEDNVHPLRKGLFLCQGAPSLQKLPCPSAQGLFQTFRLHFSHMSGALFVLLPALLPGHNSFLPM